MDKIYTIGEAAKIIGVSEETLRRWDRSGKFVSGRHPINNYRVYTGVQLQTLKTQLKNDNLQLNQVDEPPVLFYETEHGRLYQGDCISFMKTLETDSVDLIFADPPYNIKKAKWDIFKSEKDYIDWTREWVQEAARILSPSGNLYICGFPEILAEIKHEVNPLFYDCRWIVWYYRNKANLGNDWGRSHEGILHYRKNKEHIFNIDPIRIPYNEHTTKYPKRSQGKSSQYHNGKSYSWTPNPLGAKPKDVLEIPTIANGSWEKYAHETQKPVELLRSIILSSSNEDSTIYDPFGGSGTTYAVAEAYGRRWIGTEKDANYCSVIRNRVSDATHLARILDTEEEKLARERRLALRQ